VVALAGGALVARGLVAFAVTPIGQVDATAKYLHNAFFLLLALVIPGSAYHRTSPSRRVRPEG
jgi:hypothetical protein